MRFELKNINECSSPVVIRGFFTGKNSEIKAPAAKDDIYGESGAINFIAGEDGIYDILLGLGDREALTRILLKTNFARIARKLRSMRFISAALDMDTFITEKISIENVLTALVEGFIIGSAKPGVIKERNNHGAELKHVEIFTSNVIENFDRLLERHAVFAGSINFVRELVNLPANMVKPHYLLERARTEAKGLPVEVNGWNKAEIEKRGMNLILAVGGGSLNEPVLIEMKYSPDSGGNKSFPQIVLVGKGITFDSGGLDIKSVANMQTCKDDMSGAAVVIASILGAAKLRLPVSIIGIIPAAENLPGFQPMKPGDIIKSYAGLSVEIEDTDAEGRLILADALAYADQKNADLMIDIATLTGSATAALGEELSPFMTDDDELAELLEEASIVADEPIWRFPLWKPYEDKLKSDFADCKSVARKGGAGCITAALFLKKFVSKTRWAHIDIAGTAYPDSSPVLTGKGATGFGTGLLLHFIENLAKNK
jgi:leucyl aminopeptidase